VCRDHNILQLLKKRKVLKIRNWVAIRKNKREFGPEVRGTSQELASDPSRRLELQLVRKNGGHEKQVVG
jgi:hypothetical protein